MLFTGGENRIARGDTVNEKAKALYNFWSSFGITAYEINTVPKFKDLESHKKLFPYIVYESAFSSFGDKLLIGVDIFYFSTSWQEVNDKADEINRTIGRGGLTIPCGGGAIRIERGEPFCQPLNDETSEYIKRNRLNIFIEYLTEN